jgi:hypothetical protein
MVPPPPFHPISYFNMSLLSERILDNLVASYSTISYDHIYNIIQHLYCKIWHMLYSPDLHLHELGCFTINVLDKHFNTVLLKYLPQCDNNFAMAYRASLIHVSKLPIAAIFTSRMEPSLNSPLRASST